MGKQHFLFDSFLKYPNITTKALMPCIKFDCKERNKK